MSETVSKNWLRNNATFLTVLFYLILKLLFSNLLSVNEHDVLAVAKQFADPAWIPADWYLNLDSSYRLTFNVFLYPILRIVPLIWASILGRLGYYVLFAIVLQRYARSLGIPAVFMIPALFFITEIQYIIAGEWILKSLEAKTFAYAFLLLALVLLFERRFIAAASFLGLSVSFHVLVGGYGSLALLAVLVFDLPRLKPSLRVLIWAAAGYLLFASIGLISIVLNLARTDISDTVRAGLIYVHARVPHHVLPSNWVKQYGLELWRPVIKFCLSAGVCVFAVLRPAKPFQRTLGLFTLLTMIFALLGFGLYFAGKIHLLKYYFFRLPDVMLPFSGFLLVFSFLSVWNPNRFSRYSHRIRYFAGITISALLIVWAAIPFTRGVVTLSRDPLHFVYGQGIGSPKRLMLEWIKRNLPENAVFIIPPLEERFYVGAERAQFVAFKHSPQSEEAILEWYERMVLLNKGEPFRNFEIDRTSLSENYEHLSTSELLRIQTEYDMDYYIGTSARDLPFPVVYRNDKYVIYEIDGGIVRGL